MIDISESADILNKDLEPDVHIIPKGRGKGTKGKGKRRKHKDKGRESGQWFRVYDLSARP